MGKETRSIEIAVSVTPTVAAKLDEERKKMRNVSRSTAIFWILEDILCPVEVPE